MLEGKTAVVTGGTSGIGKAIAKEYVKQGAEVVVSGRTEDKGKEAAEEVGENCGFVRCDVREYDEVVGLVDTVVSEHGELDTVVNSAGVGSRGPIGEIDEETRQKILGTNLDGVMRGTKAALPHLKETEGCVVNVSSIYGLVGGRYAAAYSAAKGGVVNFTRQVAYDYADEGVRANGVCPAFVRTPMTEKALERDSFREHVISNTPMGRVAEPEEVAPIAAFLASDGASYITGVNVPVDGGWTCF
jgi:meso-butanediol dehydrogenase/(S,S)-butanediol dehydrogenase/diacetyl reductase